jgi:hypothetical protein
MKTIDQTILLQLRTEDTHFYFLLLLISKPLVFTMYHV